MSPTRAASICKRWRSPRTLAVRGDRSACGNDPGMTIPRRRIGADGPETGILALGSWHTYDRMPFAETVRLLQEAVAAGITLFDVGVYGTPDQPPVFTDVIFSAAVRAAGLARDDYVLSAKLWLEDYPGQSLKEQLEHALMRAGADYADVAILGDIHDGQDVDLAGLVLELAELAKAGLIRVWGVNNYPAADIQTMIDAAAAHGVAGPVMAQLKYSVARRSVADGEPFARIFAQGVTLEASDVFEGGLLLGKSGRQVGLDPGEIQQLISGRVPAVDELSRQLGATPAQLCLAFTLTHPSLTTTLFGATSLAQLRDNLKAVDLVGRIGADQLRELAAPLWADRDVVDPSGR